MTASEMISALRSRFQPAAGWILLPQVRDATGWKGNRTADAIAFNAWPSRGMELHGFELKTYRGDWLRELKQPAKAESICRFCDRWWIVTPAPVAEASAIIRAGELPPTWGHLTIDDDGVVCSVLTATDAPKLEPQPLDRAFVASVLRSLQASASPEAELSKAREEGRVAGVDEGWARALRRRADRDVVRFQREDLERLESCAANVLRSIRAELKQVRDLPRLPPAVDDDEGEATDVRPTPDADRKGKESC